MGLAGFFITQPYENQNSNCHCWKDLISTVKQHRRALCLSILKSYTLHGKWCGFVTEMLVRALMRQGCMRNSQSCEQDRAKRGRTQWAGERERQEDVTGKETMTRAERRDRKRGAQLEEVGWQNKGRIAASSEGKKKNHFIFSCILMSHSHPNNTYLMIKQDIDFFLFFFF